MLFGKAFPAVASKHRQQLLTHFKDSVKQAKSARQDIILINIFTAFLAALRVSEWVMLQFERRTQDYN